MAQLPLIPRGHWPVLAVTLAANARAAAAESDRGGGRLRQTPAHLHRPATRMRRRPCASVWAQGAAADAFQAPTSL
jgi:hypothetical protein